MHPRRNRPAALPEEAERGLLRYALRSPLAWALAVVFAIAGFNAYALFAWLPSILHDIAGTSPAEAGALLSLYAATGLPAGLIVPIVAARYGRVRLLVGVAIGSFIAGLPRTPPRADRRDVALGGARGPRPALLPALARAHQPAQPHPLGRGRPVGVRAVGGLPHRRHRSARRSGVLHQLTGGWVWPLVFLLVASTVPAAIAGTVVARPRFFEDERAA